MRPLWHFCPRRRLEPHSAGSLSTVTDIEALHTALDDIDLNARAAERRSPTWWDRADAATAFATVIPDAPTRLDAYFVVRWSPTRVLSLTATLRRVIYASKQAMQQHLHDQAEQPSDPICRGCLRRWPCPDSERASVVLSDMASWLGTDERPGAAQ